MPEYHEDMKVGLQANTQNHVKNDSDTVKKLILNQYLTSQSKNRC